jgi:hypothetical protein
MGSEEKMAELILYVSDRCQTDPAFGAVKLNKILFHSDFLFYKMRGRPITGMEYMKLQWGPAPRRLVPIRRELIERKELLIRPQPYGTWQQDRPIALRPADLSEFTGEEIAIVDSVISDLWGKSATDVSEETHLFAGWKLAEERETIPYPTILIAEDEEPSEEDYALAAELGHEWAGRRDRG